MADFADDFKKGDTVTVGPIGEGTKRRNDARNDRISGGDTSQVVTGPNPRTNANVELARQYQNRTPEPTNTKANNNANKSPVPKTSGQTTTTTKKVVGSIERLNISQARKKDPAYGEIRSPIVEKRLKYSGIDVADERNPDGRFERVPNHKFTNGSVKLRDKETGEFYAYPESGARIPGYNHIRARRDNRLIEVKSDGKYRSGIIEGKIDPEENKKKPAGAAVRVIESEKWKKLINGCPYTKAKAEWYNSEEDLNKYGENPF